MVEPPSSRLGILAPRLGVASETFIRRHITEIAPEQTVVVARDVHDGWTVDCPALCLQSYPNVLGKPARRLGLPWLDVRSCRMAAFLRRQRVTVLMAEWLNFAAEWYPAVRGLGTRCFAHAHGYDVTLRTLQQPSSQRLYRRLHALAGIITVSALTRQRLIDFVGFDPARIHVIPCGAAIPSAIDRHERTQVRCLSVGRLVAKKGPLDTLRAFRLARQRLPALTLELVGDGPLLRECAAFIATHDLGGVATLHGRQPHGFILERLRQADIFVLPSRTAPNGDEEGLPVSILEAMAHGLPVLSTRHAGIPEAVLDGQTGLLVNEGDWQALGEALVALAGDATRRVRMGQAGYARAAAHFSAAAESRRLRDLLLSDRPTMTS